MTDQPKQGCVKGVQLFQAGKRKGDTWTPAHLYEAVDNFKKLSTGPDKLLNPPVKIGHEEDQVRNTGQPRMGDWINLYVDQHTCEKCNGSCHWRGAPCVWCDNHEGKPSGQRTILTGDACNVPKKLAEIVKRGNYDKISAEFYHKPPEGLPGTGTTFRAASLMGGDLPQVKTLKDLQEAEWLVYHEGDITPDAYTICFAESRELDSGAVACMSEVRMTDTYGDVSSSGKSFVQPSHKSLEAKSSGSLGLLDESVDPVLVIQAGISTVKGKNDLGLTPLDSQIGKNVLDKSNQLVPANLPKKSGLGTESVGGINSSIDVSSPQTQAKQNSLAVDLLESASPIPLIPSPLRLPDSGRMAAGKPPIGVDNTSGIGTFGDSGHRDNYMEMFPENTRVERCVQKLKGRPGISPYAVCQASTHQNLHTGKPITHAELHSHLKGHGFMVDDDFEDGVILHGKHKDIHERMEHGGHCCEGEGCYSHKDIGKFNMSCYSEKHEPVKMSDWGTSTTGKGGGTTSGTHAVAEVHHALDDHLNKHVGLHTSVADDSSVSINHPYKDVHSALTKSGHVHLGSKKSDVGSGETHAYRHPQHGMFHVHTLGRGVGQAVYATRGQSALTYGEGTDDKRFDETAIASPMGKTVGFSDMYDHLARHLGKHGIAHTRPGGEHIECAEGMKHVIHHLTSKEGGHHKHHGTFHSSDGDKHEIMSHPEHGHFHLHHKDGKVHAHPGRPHNFSEDKLVPFSESNMTNEQFSELKNEILGETKTLIADFRKEFSPVVEEVKGVREDNKIIRQVAKKERIEAFVETHQKPNKNGETRIMPWEMDGTSGLPTLIDELMALDDSAPTIKFSEGNGSDQLLTPLAAKMKQIALRPPRKFSEKVKSDGTTGGSILDQDKADYDAFCEEAGALAVGDKDGVWNVLSKMPSEDRKKEIRKLQGCLQASKAGV